MAWRRIEVIGGPPAQGSHPSGRASREEFCVMAIVPDSNVGKINFYQSKNTPWAANSVAIGTSAAAVTALATKVSTAQAKLAAQVAAFEAAKNATADLRLAIRDMAGAGADIIRQIRAKAAIDGPGVYILAEIPAPPVPSPVPAPGKPANFSVSLREDGALTLKWKCPNPPGSLGTIYQVARRIGAAADFTLLGASGTKQFIDATLPAGSGSAPVTYQVTAVRSTVAGLPGQFTVNFGGAGSGGAVVASVVSQGGAPKLAA
jgi:hypothetical protein